MNDCLLIIFTRNPKLGKVKTRLAKTIGDDSALEIYKFLLQHTREITSDLKVTKQVHYSVKIRNNDLWDENRYSKKQQVGDDLGLRMMFAFQQGFQDGFKKIILIGSDMYDLSQQDIENAFLRLNTHNFVLGPADDGGYYLIGMKQLKESVFLEKSWGTNTVLQDTLLDLKDESIALLPSRNDVDIYDDIKDVEVFEKFINKK
ncbi:MAG: TIGR04282 family arsenosugar biosynthesis glycosyltransferase [Flavobacteriaceae bacterium]|nr:TIGR04282 family arsenosugar biosynthesis glycosyltransferase [Flavobacteriaceae bacterium]